MSAGILTLAGFIIFLSASMGLLAQTGASFQTVAFKQTISLFLGILAFLLFSWFDYAKLNKYSLIILIGAILVNLLLFVPGLAMHYNGASRWLDLGPFTLQPSELLKIAYIIYLASWVGLVKEKIKEIRSGLLPYIVITSVVGLILLSQKDTDTFAVVAVTGLVMLFVAGLPIRHLFLAFLLIFVTILGVVYFHPYALDRVTTFLNRGSDSQGSGYQINQSLIAIGSGQLTGRGFGESVQKFGYLPQPTDDSIFAVAAEEFGFIGGSALILLYLLLAISTFRIGNRSPDVFGGLVVIGICSLIILESFMNIAAMLGLVPLSGIPLLFVSHGGTALIIILMTMGIVANVSKRMVKV